ncbi:MAG: four helix bundle protein [Deltaproteobacteria bacterium]|nr:four helix bundle protein [Deltaproteobacteria bacterium]
MADYFPYERLDCYRLAREVAPWVREARFPPRSGDLHDQAVRAATSAALNIAEAASREGAASKQHFRIARGSAGEACAALDFCGVPGAEEQQAKLRRVGAMLRRLGQ